VTLGSFLSRCFRIMNDSDEAIPILANIEDYISPNVVSILKGTANLGKIVPADSFHDSDPNLDVVRCFWVVFDRLTQMLQRHDIHTQGVLHKV